MIVGRGSFEAAGSSIRVVPSSVQKLSQSSSKVWLQLGQRFIESDCGQLLETTHEDRKTVNHEYEKPKRQIGSARTNPHN